jgi:hypothetical protein
MASDGFSSGPLRPRALAAVLDDGVFRVERAATAPAAAPSAAEAEHRGSEGLRAALSALAEPFRGARDLRADFKVFRVEVREDRLLTHAYLAVSGAANAGFLEENSVWIATWTREDPPRLVSVEVRDFERVVRPQGTPLLADATESVLGQNASYREHLLHGLNHWLARIQDNRFFALLGTPGIAVGDVNGDGLDDLYLAQEGGLPNRLFIQEAGGSAVDVSSQSGADWLESTRGVLLADLDNDGDQDLAAAVFANLVLAAGDGKGHFETRFVFPTSQDTMSLAAADFDEDGDLDLYVCAYKRDDLVKDAGVLSIGASDDFVYHDANDAAPNVLYRNEESMFAPPLSFRDSTEEAGLNANNRRYSFAAAWEDYDRDGDLDLYVANDFGRNNLYQNQLRESGEAKFIDRAPEAGAEDSASGMGVTWGDYDLDGWPDVYVSNMFSAAGSRITPQAAFKPGSSAEVRGRLERFARGNTLLRNLGGGAFADASDAAGVTMGRWAWSSNFVDLQNDGWEDLVVANGYITTDDPGDL